MHRYTCKLHTLHTNVSATSVCGLYIKSEILVITCSAFYWSCSFYIGATFYQRFRDSTAPLTHWVESVASVIMHQATSVVTLCEFYFWNSWLYHPLDSLLKLYFASESVASLDTGCHTLYFHFRNPHVYGANVHATLPQAEPYARWTTSYAIVVM